MAGLRRQASAAGLRVCRTGHDVVGREQDRGAGAQNLGAWRRFPTSAAGTAVGSRSSLVEPPVRPKRTRRTYRDKERTGRGIDLGMLGAPVVAQLLGAQGLNLPAPPRHTRVTDDASRTTRLLLATWPRARRSATTSRSLLRVELSICCFRYVTPDLTGRPEAHDYLNVFNERMMAQVPVDGRTCYSNAVLKGNFVLRACIVNFRTEAEHIDQLLDVTAEIGARIDAEMRPEELWGRLSRVT